MRVAASGSGGRLALSRDPLLEEGNCLEAEIGRVDKRVLEAESGFTVKGRSGQICLSSVGEWYCKKDISIDYIGAKL